MLRKLLFVRGGNRNAVEDRVHSDIAEALLLTQGNPQLVEGFQQLWIHLVEAGFFVLLLGSGVINDVLVVDLRVAELRPIGFLQRQPVTESLEPELQEEIGLLLLGGDQPHHLFTEALGDLVGFDLRDEAVLVRLADEIPRGRTGHSGQPALAWMVSVEIVRVPSEQAKGLSSARNNMQ